MPDCEFFAKCGNPDMGFPYFVIIRRDGTEEGGVYDKAVEIGRASGTHHNGQKD